MAKYSDEFKVMIVREYLTGRLGFSKLTKKYGMKSTGQLRAWVSAYQKYGVDGIMRKKSKEVYSVQFKLDVLSFMKRTGASRTETALHFGLTNPPLISSWKKRFLEGGAEALANPKGRPTMSEKAKNVKTTKKSTQQDEMTREQKLERENELLRLEVEYLKSCELFRWIRTAISKSTNSVIIRTQRRIPTEGCTSNCRHSRVFLSLSY